MIVSVDLTKCPVAPKGSNQPGECNWCSKPLVGRQRKWCSPDHYQQFLREHLYTSAKAWCHGLSEGPCGCLPIVFQICYPDGRLYRTLPPHHLCAECGRCDHVAGRLECNHIVPRLGNRASVSCMHHQSNLEMLCGPCHQLKTNEQRKDWPARAAPKPRKKRTVQPRVRRR